MKRTLILSATALLIVSSAIYAFADIARPKPTATPESKIVLHSRLSVAVEPKLWDARLQIPEETLKQILAEAGTKPASASLSQRVMHSSSRTIMAGVFMFLAVSFGGVWLARSSQKRNNKVIAAVVVGAAMLSLATIIVRANAGPPGSYYWRNLPQNLQKGQETSGGVDIEIVPGNGQITLVLPLKNTTRKPGEE